MSYSDKIFALTKQFYPTGRAWKIPFGGTLEALHLALGVSETQAYTDAVAIHYSILPDNDNFSIADATDWERRLGLITNQLISLSDRKLAILRKLNQPGVTPAKSNWRYLQKQLQDAGFDVYVYENRFDDYPDGYITKTPDEFTLTTYPASITYQHGDHQHGDIQHGSAFANQIANSIFQSVDNLFEIGENFRSTFFIGGATSGSYASVDSERETEFRQLILNIKPVQTVGFLLINYT